MKHQAIGRFVSFLFLAGMMPAMARAEGKAPGRYDLIVARAIRLLPKSPMQVAVIDADEARPEVRATLLRLDAFTVPGSKVVYLVEQSAVLQGAAKGSQLYEHMLASIIWHEMAHADGAGEPAAQGAEEQPWTQFVRDGIFDQVTALRYLQALAVRPDDRLPSGDTVTEVPWPRVYIRDRFTGAAARRALQGASERLTTTACRSIFSDIHDGWGLPLTEKLGELGASPQAYLRLAIFLDGDGSPQCRKPGVLAFTARGGRIVYLCGRDFERAERRDPREAQVAILHELLHSLGLGEIHRRRRRLVSGFSSAARSDAQLQQRRPS